MTLSVDLRSLIISQYHEDHMAVEEIAGLVGCSEKTVYRIIQNHEDTGLLFNSQTHSRGRPRTPNTADINYLSSLLSANPTLYLDELQEQLHMVRNVHVLISTIC
jgi:transposase